MSGRVTIAAERDQIAFIIRAAVATKFSVMDFEVCHGTARLTIRGAGDTGKDWQDVIRILAGWRARI